MSLDLSIHHVCGLDELAEAPLAQADRIVSIIGPDAPTPPELSHVDKPILTLRFDDVLDAADAYRPPTEQDIREAIAFDADATAEERLVVHCSAGISRSTAVIAVLLAARHPGFEDEVFAAIRLMRPQAWPNSRIVAIGDDLLNRRGSLIAALQRHYEAQLRANPEVGHVMIELGRASEVLFRTEERR